MHSSQQCILWFPSVSLDFLWFGAGWILWFSSDFLWFPSVSFDFLWFGAGWILRFSFDFLWFPSVSFDFLWFGAGWILRFSFGFLWFCLVSKGERKKKKINGKDKPIKESLRRLQAHRMHQSCLLLRRLLECWQLGYVGIHRINLKTFGTTKTMMKHFLLSPFAFGMVVRRSNFRGKRNYGSSTPEHFCRLTGRLQNRCHWSHITLRYDMICHVWSCLITHLEGVASQTT